jgi:hypothetical protein
MPSPDMSCEHKSGVCGGFRLLNFLFMFDPTKRATAEECLQSSYFQVCCLQFRFFCIFLFIIVGFGRACAPVYCVHPLF